LVLLIASRSTAFQQYYAVKDFNPLFYTLETLAVLFAQEFFFRGFLIFGLKDRLKEVAIFVQVIPFVLVHIGKPEIETLSTILTGILFGYIAYRGRSFWPAYIIHIFINLFFVLYINLALHPVVA
jgi:membrane protease YdiL (CAAX protease family)